MVAFGGIADMDGFPASRVTAQNDPNVWSGRAGQEVSSTQADAVLHQCIRPLIGAFVLPAIMDISAHAILLPAKPRAGYLGHQCSHAPGRPILHRRLILSQTSAGKGVGYII